MTFPWSVIGQRGRYSWQNGQLGETIVPTERSLHLITVGTLIHLQQGRRKKEGSLTCFLFTVGGCLVCEGVVHLFTKWCRLQGKGTFVYMKSNYVLASAFSMHLLLL